MAQFSHKHCYGYVSPGKIPVDRSITQGARYLKHNPSPSRTAMLPSPPHARANFSVLRSLRSTSRMVEERECCRAIEMIDLMLRLDFCEIEHPDHFLQY